MSVCYDVDVVLGTMIIPWRYAEIAAFEKKRDAKTVPHTPMVQIFGEIRDRVLTDYDIEEIERKKKEQLDELRSQMSTEGLHKNNHEGQENEDEEND